MVRAGIQVRGREGLIGEVARVRAIQRAVLRAGPDAVPIGKGLSAIGFGSPSSRSSVGAWSGGAV